MARSPLLTTLAAIPGTAVLLSLIGITAMGMAYCGPGECPRAETHRAIAWTMLLAGPVPVLAGWIILPGRASFGLGRWLILVAYIAMFLIGVLALLTMPIRE